MSINFKAPDSDVDLKLRIVVVGIGGAGGNAVNNMIRSNLEGVEFVVANTDVQALKHSQADQKIQLGTEVTQGLGAGARPEVGREAAIESMEDIMQHLSGANMIFITAGMGGGTGTGAAPVLAETCRDHGMLTVGVVTKPFHFEGAHRMRAAEQGIEELQQFVDTLIIIPNQNLFRVANEKTTFADAFKMADDVLCSGVRGVTDLMIMPGLINLDFADIRTVMSEMGKAMMGAGEAEGDNRAIMAAESAISNPLLEDVSMKGARGVLINITGGPDMTLFEVDEAANRIREEVDSDANIIFGSTFDETLEGPMRVSVIATGIESDAAHMPRPHVKASVTPLRPRKIDVVEAPAAEACTAQAARPNASEADFKADPYDDTAAAAPTSKEPAVGACAQDVSARDVPPQGVPTADTGNRATEAPEPALFGTPVQVPSATEVDPEPGSALQTGPTRAPAAEAPPEPVRPKDAFIPPRPVRPEELNRSGRTPRKAAEPFREAEIINAGDRPQKSKQSLFGRMTGLGLSTKQAPAKPSDPSMAKITPARPQVADAPKAAEPDLAPTRAEEEMLEIPAFLRRQAN